MYFYRSMHVFYAITIDLDNTLYNNYPVIARVEEKLISFLKRYHPALVKIRKYDCDIARKMLKLEDPEICHNVNFWRWKSLECVLLKYGLSKADAQLGADKGMEIVFFWRNQIHISMSTYQVLSALKDKWPLIAITNGNANPEVFGLKKYFNDVLKAGVHGRSKPFEDMYYLSSKYFGISDKYILHIGDDLRTDIQGALRSGRQTCWVNQYNLNLEQKNLVLNLKLLPHMRISDLSLLTCLI